MAAQHSRSSATPAALRAIDVQSALCAVLEHGIVVFTFAFLLASTDSRELLKNKKASSELKQTATAVLNDRRRRFFNHKPPRFGPKRARDEDS
jgi:hypothetical protein